MQIDSQAIKVLAFDVFGTVVDWRSSVIAEGYQLGKAKGLQIDWAAFADAWRAIYRPYMDRVQNGELVWTKIKAPSPGKSALQTIDTQRIRGILAGYAGSDRR